ncbi:ER membrane protein DP1/Yop1 [Tilletia horrida]|uniref:Protein YOP1 n=1 Tax=Tilletia horrida TaxID=155126 RepID=A0AAN6GAK4_9BASI|nr:ER membrane protein DP1/Yop1 [Tilletia horrida]KAK0522833.1 ER membrane protein DP1/Yop1 [Tilletia horrida]KAK0523040.1 ER membrane protein DP1/Yop1 [Tilletia horrida]KAK0553942.1 ER membrane protein DP1/Yop1 [Tilletia horrida]
MAAQLQQLQAKAEYFVAQLDKELAKFPQIVKFEQTTHVPKAYAAIGSFSIFVILIFFNIFAGFLTTLLGFVLPAYFSMRALETKGPEDDIQWLTYWTVFGFFSFLESFSVRLLLYYVPYYYTIKALAITWLMLPQTQGAKVVYGKFLRPVLAQFIKASPSPAVPQAAPAPQ